MTKDDIHKHLKDKLLSFEEYDPLEKKNVVRVKSTTDLNKKEFIQFLNDIEKYMWSYHEYVIPLHNFF
jgi:hypothetical protein